MRSATVFQDGDDGRGYRNVYNISGGSKTNLIRSLMYYAGTDYIIIARVVFCMELYYTLVSVTGHALG